MELFTGCASVALAVGAVFAARSAPTESDVRAVEAEVVRLERELSDARAENRTLETKCAALGFTADLMSGRRSEPLRKQIVEKTLLHLCEQPVTLDNRASGKTEVWKKWLNLPTGKRYRVRTTLAISEISGTANFKFGAMVTQSGKSPNWPAALVGGQPISERDISFEFFCPEEGQALLLIGFETGKGLAVFRNVRISELTEELK